MPFDLPRWLEPMRLIDCGAYDGDAMRAMLDNGYVIERVAAFEPDPNNYTKLVKRLRDFDAICMPCGVSASTSQVRFNAGKGTASKIAVDGKIMIQCVSIDEALPSFGPTLIKMDVEGAESSALSGAERTLRRYRP